MNLELTFSSSSARPSEISNSVSPLVRLYNIHSSSASEARSNVVEGADKYAARSLGTGGGAMTSRYKEPWLEKAMLYMYRAKDKCVASFRDQLKGSLKRV
jgi:hypothetical protein